MNEIIQENVEEFLLHSKSNPTNISLSNEMLADSQFREQYEKTAILQEALLRANVRNAVNKARQDAMKNKRSSNIFRYAIPSTGIAAGIAIFFLFKPIDIGNPEEVLRGENSRGAAIYPLSKEESLIISAQKMIKNNDNLKAISVLEPLIEQTDIRKFHENRIKWLLSVAYLQAKMPRKSEKLLNSIDCEEGTGSCPYEEKEAKHMRLKIFFDKIRYED